MAKNRMPPSLVALSSAAITAIYVAGYLRTEAADASIGASDAATPTVVAPASAPTAPTVASGRAARAAPSTAPAQTSQAQQPLGYQDGTYSGHGTSRRGDVWVNVTVAGGQITAVEITDSTLQYPLRDIAVLPGEVVQRQSAQVDIVSRATYSSQAFRGAVSQALTQAVGA